MLKYVKGVLKLKMIGDNGASTVGLNKGEEGDYLASVESLRFSERWWDESKYVDCEESDRVLIKIDDLETIKALYKNARGDLSANKIIEDDREPGARSEASMEYFRGGRKFPSSAITFYREKSLGDYNMAVICSDTEKEARKFEKKLSRHKARF